jgi:short-subunit dehydrogenase
MKAFKQRYGEWALINGGTSGIGAALARQLAEAGLNLVLVARQQKALAFHAARLSSDYQVQVRVVSADLTQPEGLTQVLESVADLEIGMLIPCAAIETQGVFVKGDAQRQRDLVQMNVITPMELARTLGKPMAERGRGAILFVSSLSGWMPQPWMAGYGASKSYVSALAAGMHFEMKRSGVDVSVLSPGPTDTPMAKATGIDFAAMGMTVMPPEAVAACGLNALGHRLDAIPGWKNRMMVFMMSRLMSRASAGFMFRKMMGKALGITT